MDVKAARRVTASMVEQREQAFKADLKVMVTPDAGHYPAIDQPGGWAAAASWHHAGLGGLAAELGEWRCSGLQNPAARSSPNHLA